MPLNNGTCSFAHKGASSPTRGNPSRTSFRLEVMRAASLLGCMRRELRAIFIKMAKEGSTLSGFMDGVALSISIGLQYGVPLKVFVDKLTNTRFEPSGYTENPNIRYASSVLDYIARWLGGKFLSPEYLKPRAASSDQDMIRPAISSPAADTVNRKPIQLSNSGGTTGDAPSCST